MQVTIEINNSYSQVLGLTTDQHRAMKKALSYEVAPAAAYYMGGHKPRLKSLIDAKGYFPSGLLTTLRQELLTIQVIPTMKDLRRKPLLRGLHGSGVGIKPYLSQIEARDKALAAGRGGISMPTGSGKSLVIALIIAKAGLKTLIVVPTLALKQQLTADLLERLGPKAKFKVENIDSPVLKTLTDFDVLIIDEAHRVAAKTYQDLNKTTWTKIYYRFFLTATYFRNQSNEHLLFEGLAGDLVYKLNYQDSVKEGYIVPVEAYYYDLPKVPVEGYTYAQVYSELVVNNEYRNNLIASVLTSLQAQGASTLCLVKEIKHGEILSALTGIPFVNGQDDGSRDYIRQFNTGEIKVLIGTTGIMSEGIDSKPCEYVVIATPGKAKSGFMQSVGRAVRRYPGKESAKIVLFRDKSNKWMLTHFNAQAKVLLEEYNVKITKLEDL
jgi:superfamily II DNA or RNA helicase